MLRITVIEADMWAGYKDVMLCIKIVKTFGEIAAFFFSNINHLKLRTGGKWRGVITFTIA
jgi:hypothetical protein